MTGKLTEMVFIVDRSGSMSGLESDTIGGFNSMIEKQKKEGDAIVSTVLFSNRTEILHDRVDLKDVQKLTEKEYYVNYLKQGNGRASDCIACRKCERVCPQHIKISEWMPKLKVEMEDNNYLMN